MSTAQQFVRPTDVTEEKPEATLANGRGFFGFFSELRRRKVCRAATTYAVVLWLVYQVVELVAPELGLPDWTLRFVILIGLLVFPIALILSWMFEITPEGVVIDCDGSASGQAARLPTRPLDRAIDFILLLAALVIATQLGIGAVGTATASQLLDDQKIVVAPFRVSGSTDTADWSEGLMIELQHELASQTDITVIAPKDPYEAKDSVVLAGAVSATESKVHVTVTLVDTDTHIVSWSQTFEFSGSDSRPTPAKVARRIVVALLMSKNDSDST